MTTWSISANPNPVNEDAGSTTLVITRSSGSGSQTVYVSTLNGVDGYSTNSNDYNGIANFAVTFASGVTTEDVTLGINNLDLTSGTPTYGLLLQSVDTTSLTADVLASNSFTIDDNDAAAVNWTISANPNPVNEDAGSTTLVITRSSGSGSQTVYVSTLNGVDGYSTNSNDYNGIANFAVTFASGVTTEDVTLGINNLDLTSGTPTYGLLLQSVDTTSLTADVLASNSFTIDDNDAAAVNWSISANPNPVNEDAGSTTLVITRSSGSGSQTVYVSTLNGIDGYSVNNGDYATNVDNLPVTFASGATQETVTLGINDLGLQSGTLTYGLLVQSVNTPSLTAGVLASNSLTIDDNDASASATSYSVSASPDPVNDNAGTITFTITRSGNLPAETLFASTVNNIDGYNANDGDYATNVNNLPVSFGAGVTSQTVTLDVINQTLPEPDATFGFVVQRSASDPVSTYLATTNWTLHDVVSGPVIQYAVTASPGSVVENGGPVTFTITRSGSNLPEQTLYASTVDGTQNTEYATNPGEFANLPFQAVVFAAGAQTATVTLRLTNETTPESSNNFGFVVTYDANLNDTLATTNFTITGDQTHSAPILTPTQIGDTQTSDIEHGVDYSLAGNGGTATAGMDLPAIQAYNGFGPYAYTGGTQFVATYIGNHDTGYLTQSPDVAALTRAGFSIVSIFETNPTFAGYFTRAQADSDVADAIQAAQKAGQPLGSGAIYFTVDYPAPQSDLSAIDSYFQEIRADLTADGNPYQLGVYAPGSVLSMLVGDPTVKPDYTWLTLFAWGPEGFTGENIDQTYTSPQPDNASSNRPYLAIGTSTQAVDLDTSNTQEFGQWGSQSVSLATPLSQTVVGPGANGVLTLIGDSTTASNFAIEAQDGNIGAFNNITGKETLEATQFGELAFNGVSTLTIDDLNGTDITDDTIYYNGPDGGDYLDASADSGTVVATVGNGNNTIIGDGNTVVSYASSPNGVTVNLANGTASNGYGGTDTLTNIHSFVGSTAGTNTIAYNGPHTDYSYQQLSDGSLQVADQRSGSPDGTDEFQNFQEFEFTDGTFTAGQLLQGPPPPPPPPPPPTAPGTTAAMVMRDGGNGNYEIYDIGGNAIMAAAALGQVGLEWQVGGLGGFNGASTSDMILRNSNSGILELYDISNNQITFGAPIGQVGLEWSVAGFGDFSARASETDMLVRNTNTGQFDVFDISNNQITSAAPMGQVGLEWSVAGFGDFSGHANETDMLMRNNNTGAFEVFDINNNQITFAAGMGQVGLEWSMAGFGDFSGHANETDMLMRNNNTGAFEVFDISNNQITFATGMGQVGLEWQVAGFGPFNGTGSSDMLIRNTNTGVLDYYDISNNQITAGGPMGQVGLEWSVAGIAADPPGSSSSAAQLTQTLASFAPADPPASGVITSAGAGSQVAGTSPLLVPVQPPLA